jgi:hypothetical protein
MHHLQCSWDVESESLPVDVSKAPSGESSVSSSKAASVKGGSETKEKTADTIEPVKVNFLTEQTSHHPPVSAFYIDCPSKGISARGYDQLCGKFTGTSIKIYPGAYNLGIFLTLHKRNNEEYQLTHPTAYLGGLLKGEC